MEHKASTGWLHSDWKRVRTWGDGEGEVLTGDGGIPSGGSDCGARESLGEGPAHG
jgi:hypothetical protein